MHPMEKNFLLLRDKPGLEPFIKHLNWSDPLFKPAVNTYNSSHHSWQDDTRKL